MRLEKVFAIKWASLYPMYVKKAEAKGRTKEELDQVIRWLTGYTQKKLDAQIEKKTTFEGFFAEAPKLNPSRALITGMICGMVMRRNRYQRPAPSVQAAS